MTVAFNREVIYPVYVKSCSGKTRSVLELGHHLPLFYVCQRQLGDSGYPKQSVKLTEKLALTSEEREQCKGELYHLDAFVYCKCVSFLCALSIVASAAWRNYQRQVIEEKTMDESDFFVEFMEKQYTEAFWDPIMKIVKELAQALYALVPLSEVRQKDRWICIEDALKDTVELIMFSASNSPQDKGTHLRWILCVDEAREVQKEKPDDLLSDFLSQLNRASRLLPVGAVFVFMDTLSDINIINRHPFPSDRMRLLAETQLVYTDLLTFDLGYPAAKYINDTWSHVYMCQFGRPWWFAKLQKNAQWTEILDSAKAKLAFCQKPGKKEPDFISSVALLSSRVAFDFDATYKTKELLVGSYMAHVDYYSPVERDIFISYPSDPVVSEAAKALLFAEWESVISSISHAIISRTINVGALGELAAQIICVLAMDQARMVANGPPTVEQFLQCISGDKVEMGESTIAKGLLNFNHFVQVEDYNVNRGDLVNFVRRRAAMVCKRNTRGVDLVIPVILNKSYGSVVRETTLERPQNDTRKDSMILDIPKLEDIENSFQDSEYDRKMKLLEIIDADKQMGSPPKKRPRHTEGFGNGAVKVLK